MNVLRPHQIDMVTEYVAGRVKFLAAEQGLGKTATAIEIARQLDARNILVICPASVKAVWRHEIRKWSAEKQWIEIPESADAVKGERTARPRWRIVNYDRLTRTPGFIDALIAAGPYDVAVLDESHMLKDAAAQRTRLVYGTLAKHCTRLLPLTGTPMPNHPGELYTHVRALAPELITNERGVVMSQQSWENRYCQVELRRIGSRLVRVIKGAKNVTELREKLQSFMIRKTKAEVMPDLPPIEFVDVPLFLNWRMSATVDELGRIAEEMEDEDVLRHLRVADEHISRALATLGYAKAEAAGQYLFDFLVDSDVKVICWFTNTDALDCVMSRLSDFAPVKIDGRSTPRERVMSVERFLNDPTCRVFCGNIKAAGTGITLLNEKVQPRDIFFIQSSFSPGENAQAAARSHRIGARDGVLARVFVAEGVALDERIQSIIARKANDIANIMDGECND